MAQVALKGMEFYAFHGYYDFERRVGNRFILDVEVTIDIQDNPQDRIEQTVNYEQIYKLSAVHMQKKYKLLETLAYDIAQSIKISCDMVEKVMVRLTKKNPPLEGKVDSAMVMITL